MAKHDLDTAGSRRALATLLSATLVVALLVVPSAPALANHEPSLVHQPSPVAPSRTDLALPLVVYGDCHFFCTPVEVKLRYRAADGSLHTIRKSLGAFPTFQLTVLIVPARHIQAPELHYWLSADQDSCWFDACHEGTARSPKTGWHAVAVP